MIKKTASRGMIRGDRLGLYYAGHCPHCTRKNAYVSQAGIKTRATRRGDRWGTLITIIWECKSCHRGQVETQHWTPSDQLKLPGF